MLLKHPGLYIVLPIMAAVIFLSTLSSMFESNVHVREWREKQAAAEKERRQKQELAEALKQAQEKIGRHLGMFGKASNHFKPGKGEWELKPVKGEWKWISISFQDDAECELLHSLDNGRTKTYMVTGYLWVSGEEKGVRIRHRYGTNVTFEYGQWHLSRPIFIDGIEVQDNRKENKQ